MKYKLYKGQGGYLGFQREDGVLANPPEIVAVLEKQQYRIQEVETAAHLYEREIQDLRTAMELLAVEVAWRRKFGYCPNEVFENVNNNQTCRTALTDAGCSPVEMQDRKDTIIADPNAWI
jgi:hypothetical protein